MYLVNGCSKQCSWGHGGTGILLVMRTPMCLLCPGEELSPDRHVFDLRKFILSWSLLSPALQYSPILSVAPSYRAVVYLVEVLVCTSLMQHDAEYFL